MVRSRFFLLAAVLLSACSLFAQSNSVVNDLNITFTTVDVPGAGLTVISGINTAGEMVGWYADSNTSPATGFLLSNGTISSFSYPSSNSTLAFGINDEGLISGSAYVKGDTAAVSFLYDGTLFTTLRAPGDSATLARGINNAGVVVGGNGLTLSGTKGFALLGKQFKTVSPPGVYTYVFADGINNLNQIVGTDDSGGFFFSKGKYQTLSYPGASQTQPWGINDGSMTVGWYVQCTPVCDHGFVLFKGKYVPLDFPGSVGTFAFGINGPGQVVGSYEDSAGVFHGFVTSPITAKQFEAAGTVASDSPSS